MFVFVAFAFVTFSGFVAVRQAIVTHTKMSHLTQLPIVQVLASAVVGVSVFLGMMFLFFILKGFWDAAPFLFFVIVGIISFFTFKALKRQN